MGIDYFYSEQYFYSIPETLYFPEQSNLSRCGFNLCLENMSSRWVGTADMSLSLALSQFTKHVMLKLGNIMPDFLQYFKKYISIGIKPKRWF